MSISDRITEDADWKDGMNAFRSKIWEELSRLDAEIEAIKIKLTKKETTP